MGAKIFWNERFKGEEYVYGVEPNEFFRESFEKYQLNGRALFVAEGEGRNSVFAAKKGADVVAVDVSTEGKKKAETLAKKESVKIEYIIKDIAELDYKNEFDFAVLIFAHFPDFLREDFHKKVIDSLKVGGIVVLEAYTQKQLELRKLFPHNGGPSSLEMLYTKEQIENDFKDLDILYIEEREIDLNEGRFHSGKSSVIRLIAKVGAPLRGRP